MSVIIHRSTAQGFSLLPNDLLRDPAMSARARGVLVTLLSHEDGWQQSATYTEQEMTDGRYAIRAALKELADLGYVERERRPRSGGRWQTDIHVYDTPKRAVPPQSVGPTSVAPTVGQTALSTKNPEDVEPLEVKDMREQPTRASLPTPYLEDFEAFWKPYPIHRDKRKALLAWQRARRRATTDQINEGVRRYSAWLAANPDAPVKYAEGWLNGDRWLDDLTDDAADRQVAALRRRMGTA